MTLDISWYIVLCGEAIRMAGPREECEIYKNPDDEMLSYGEWLDRYHPQVTVK